MKILLDENIDVNFALQFKEGEVYTVNQMGWSSKKNGELLQLASENNFDFFITLDKNIKYQQNLNKYNFSVILLLVKNSKIDTLLKLYNKITETIDSKPEKKLIEIE
jgi:predicted nuclease of predicted toxin-antitoxin system